MELLHLSLPTAPENVALDEALLQLCQTGGTQREILRIWESPQDVVVVGRASQVQREVDPAACRQQDVEILRRCSGGGAIVAGAGCLMYAVVLSLERRPALRAIDAAHRHVLEQLIEACGRCGQSVRRRGLSDLALDDLKVSGNSLRLSQSHLLYHGTLLYDFQLSKIPQLLQMPPRQPDYRAGRPHQQFVTNLPVDPRQLIQALPVVWQAESIMQEWPLELTHQLVQQRYGRSEWNLSR